MVIDIIKFEKHFLNSTTDTKNWLLNIYNIGSKTLLQQGISEPLFYGDLVYKFNRIVGKSNFSDQFKKIVKRYISVTGSRYIIHFYCLAVEDGFKATW